MINKITDPFRAAAYAHLENGDFQNKTEKLLKKIKEKDDWALERKTSRYSRGEIAIVIGMTLAIAIDAIKGAASRCNEAPLPALATLILLDNIEKGKSAQRIERGKLTQMADWYKRNTASSNCQNLAKGLDTIEKTAIAYTSFRNAAEGFLAVTLVAAVGPSCNYTFLKTPAVAIGLTATSAFAVLHLIAKNGFEEKIRQNVHACLGILEKEKSISSAKKL